MPRRRARPRRRPARSRSCSTAPWLSLVRFGNGTGATLAAAPHGHKEGKGRVERPGAGVTQAGAGGSLLLCAGIGPLGGSRRRRGRGDRRRRRRGRGKPHLGTGLLLLLLLLL